MIISKKYAKKLVKEGKAKEPIELKPDHKGRVYCGITRIDIARVDHYIDRVEA